MKPMLAKFMLMVATSAMIGVLTLGLGAPPAYADDTAGTPGPRALERAYRRQQKALTVQQGNLDKANGAVSKVQSWIDLLNGKGVDTTALTAAVSAFQTQVATAQTAHDSAAAILSAHAGFDADGKVTDAEQAQQTVATAHQALSDARETLRQAREDLRAALRKFREEHKPEVKATPAPTIVPFNP